MSGTRRHPSERRRAWTAQQAHALSLMLTEGHASHRRCAGKLRHPSRKVAAGVVRCMVADGQDHQRPGKRLMPYKCKTCHGWHVGNGWGT